MYLGGNFLFVRCLEQIVQSRMTSLKHGNFDIANQGLARISILAVFLKFLGVHTKVSQ